MGQFSWLDCKTGEQVLVGFGRSSYLLVPREFGGGHIEEGWYDGYGHFCGRDVYDLVAEWNREHIDLDVIPSKSWCEWHFGGEGKARKAFDDFRDDVDDETMCERYGDDYKRVIGIAIACRDDDNAGIRYPIKITHDESAVYEECEPSRNDPDQGWPRWQLRGGRRVAEVHNNVRCPVCGSENVDGGPFDVEQGECYQSCHCDECGSSWNDRYKFDSCVDIERGE